MPISGHEEGAPGLKLTCPQAKAVFPEAGVHLAQEAPTTLVLDEHGGTFVVRLEGLQVREPPIPGGGDGIFLTVALPEATALAAGVESFAAQQGLPLARGGSPAPELALRPTLAACHVPGPNLFVYAEDARLEVRASSGQSLEVRVTGTFKTRRVPCREPDIVIHLSRSEMAQLLVYLLALARGRG